MEERLTTYRGVRIDDTAEWRLVIYISEGGMSAYLKNIEDALEPIVTLFEDQWGKGEDNLLQKIEGAVYDHPQLMDDFSTDIVICTPRALWVPEKVAADSEDVATIYNKVYTGEEDDIMVDTLDGMACLYMLAPGLTGFLRRTLSGARVMCHQTVELRRFMSRGADQPRIYVDIREGEADYLVIDDKKLLLAATHEWHDVNDIAYMVFNIVDVEGLNAAETQVSLSGEKEVRTGLLKMLRERVGYAMLTMMPSAVSKMEMPLAAALCLSKS